MGNKAKASGTRGTDLLETLSSANLNKKAAAKLKSTGTSTGAKKSNSKESEKTQRKKKATSISFAASRKKPTTSEKDGKNENIPNDEKKASDVTSSNAKKTGFQLFMESVKTNDGEENENDENTIPQVMQKWKALSNEEKTTWNEKA